jgi:ParB/RepB/Spo0J family partition protein
MDDATDKKTVIGPVDAFIPRPAAARTPVTAGVFGTMLEVSLDKLDDNPFQARISMDPEKLDQLARDIASHGLLEPIVVRRAGERFQVAAGHRRVAAFKLLKDLASSDAERQKYSVIPAQLKEIKDDQEMEELGLVENLRREDLTPLERAEAVARFRERRNLSTKQVAEKLNESHDAVKALLRLFDAPQVLKDGISKGIMVTVLDSSGAPVTTPGGREKQERRTLDLSAADELGRLYPFWSEADGEKKAATRLEALIQRVLREGWAFRRVQAHCKDVLAGRAPKAGTERAAVPAFTFDERKLSVDLKRLAAMDADQRQALRGALHDVLGRL